MMHPSNWVAIIKTDQKIEVELCCRKLTKALICVCVRKNKEE